MSARAISPATTTTPLHRTPSDAVNRLNASYRQLHRQVRHLSRAPGRSARANRAHPAVLHAMSRLVYLLDGGLDRTRRICWPLGTMGLVLGAYLTLRPSSNLKSVWWIPSTIGHWCEQHGQSRNVPAFFLLALPFLIALRRPGQRFVAIASLAVFGAAVELAQLALPGRWHEWEDIALTWAGLALAYGFSGASRAFLRGLRSLSSPVNRHRAPSTNVPLMTETATAISGSRVSDSR